jgi:uncharacterized membrane-anchored protein
MQKTYILIAFLAVAVLQLVVPAQMIFSKEKVLTTGRLYKFNTQPVDPNDPFRGKYITLRYRLNSAKTMDTTWQRKEAVYIYLKEDSLGFAIADTVSKMPLNISQDYVVGTVNWYRKNQQNISFDLPFDRFYMNEYKAKPAEDAYREAQRDSLPDNTYALVAIKEGKVVLKDVMINEVSIATYVKNSMLEE